MTTYLSSWIRRREHDDDGMQVLAAVAVRGCLPLVRGPAKGLTDVDRMAKILLPFAGREIPAVRPWVPRHECPSLARSTGRGDPPPNRRPPRRMIRPRRLFLPNSPIHRTPLPSPPRPRRSPLSACLAAQTLAPARRLAPLGLLMDPAPPSAGADADAETNGDAVAYVDAAEFADAGVGGEDAEPRVTAGGYEPPKELPEELAKGVVCLECATSAQAVEAGERGTCRVYVVGTAHVSQVSSPRPALLTPRTQFQPRFRE